MSAKHLVAKNIKRIRKDAGLTQEALAKKCGMSVRYIWHLETAAANTTLDTLEAVARGLGCTLFDLIHDSAASKDVKNRLPKSARPGIDFAIRVLQDLRRKG
jgi:transcriptional regulator with XRE-family HTH domain